MGRLRITAGVAAAITVGGLVPAATASAAGQYGHIRPSAILQTVGGGTFYQRQGETVAVSADGNTVAVGGGESMPRGGDHWTGHVYIWVRTDRGWHQQTVLSPPLTDPATRGFGRAVSLSPDGRYLAVGDATAHPYPGGIFYQGAVYFYTHTATGWSAPTTIPDPGAGRYDQFGQSVAISADGTSLVAGAPYDGYPNGVRGAAWAFTRGVNGWGPGQRLPAPPGSISSVYANSVALSGDGRHAAVINSTADFTGVPYAGDVLTFDRSATGAWTAGAVLGDQPPTADGGFGWSAAMSTDASTLVIGSINGIGDLGSRVAVFRRDSGRWQRSAQFFGYNSSHNSEFGFSVAVSASGDVVAVGVPARPSATAFASGAVQRYRRSGTTWSYLGPTYIKGAGADESDGFALALSGTADRLYIGAPGYAHSNRPNATTGAVYVIS